MNPQAASILDSLHAVAAQRQARARDPLLAERTSAVKAFQHDRFQRTYADLLQSQRYGAAARFFLADLYGPSDFSKRDAQFARVVPTMVRLLPAEPIHTVKVMGELHALAEQLDSAMARAIDQLPLQPRGYVLAWRAVGRRPDREAQIRMLHDVGLALDAYTTKPLLRHTLRLMRAPARAAGLGDLQRFLELGFETFRRMRGAQDFLQNIVRRETRLAEAMFDATIDEAQALLMATAS